MAESKQHALAQRLWDADAAFRTQAENVKKLTRQTMVQDYVLNGRKYTVAPTAKPMAIVQMFAAFPEITPRISIPPLIQDNEEDEKASRIERFLNGVRRATTYGGIHPDDAVWIHGGEVGRGILYCQFDLDLAKEGVFPFRRKSIDPCTFAFKASDRGLVCAVTVEERDALELYDELYGVYEKVRDNKDTEWEIPDVLKRAYENYEQQTVRVMRFWDREREYMWVAGEPVWRMDGQEGRPHLMEEVPFQVGFVMQMPSDKPEQLGSGLIHFVRGDIINRSKMLDKAYLGFEFFFMPMVQIEGRDGTVRFEQAVPGAVYEQGAKVAQINPVTNGNMLEQLLGHSEKEINDAALSETSMSGDIPSVSGFLFSQANSGPQRRNNRLLDSITDAYKKHYSLILNCIERFANREKAADFCGGDASAIKKYLASFTTFSPMKADPNKKVKLTVTLDSATVKGYQIVDVDFRPEPPEDANAKYQRAQLAKAFMPQEHIDRDILKVESPEQIAQWRKEEILMTDPDWQARMIAMWKRQKLAQDEKLRTEFQMQDLEALPPEIRDLVLQAIQAGMSFDEAMAQADQLVAQSQPQQQPVDPNAQAQQVDANGQPIQQPMQGQPQPQSTGQVDPAMLQQFLAQLPPEVAQLFQDPQIQQAFMQMIEQGMPPEQALQQIIQAVQQAQGQQQQQQPSGGFVSSAQMGQAPVSPTQTASMQGF